MASRGEIWKSSSTGRRPKCMKHTWAVWSLPVTLEETRFFLFHIYIHPLCSRLCYFCIGLYVLQIFFSGAMFGAEEKNNTDGCTEKSSKIWRRVVGDFDTLLEGNNRLRKPIHMSWQILRNFWPEQATQSSSAYLDVSSWFSINEEHCMRRMAGWPSPHDGINQISLFS